MSLTPFERELARKVQVVCANRSIHEIARLTGTNPETTRRYVRGFSPPSAEFLAGLCMALGLSGEWILNGRGPAQSASFCDEVLRSASLRQLLGAVADRVDVTQPSSKSLSPRIVVTNGRLPT